MITMRGAFRSSIARLGAPQSWGAPFRAVASAAPWFGITGVLVALGRYLYRFGVWRENLDNRIDNVATDVKALREESTANLGRVERQMDAMNHVLAVIAEELARMNRGHARMERRLDRLERSEVQRVEAS